MYMVYSLASSVCSKSYSSICQTKQNSYSSATNSENIYLQLQHHLQRVYAFLQHCKCNPQKFIIRCEFILPNSLPNIVIDQLRYRISNKKITCFGYWIILKSCEISHAIKKKSYSDWRVWTTTFVRKFTW